eukprot:15156015-Heterocapsa_arctica.AAC.1
MRKAAVHPQAITEDELSSENAARGVMLYSLVVTLVAGKALGIVRKVQEGYGLEAWRRLILEYEPQVPT